MINSTNSHGDVLSVFLTGQRLIDECSNSRKLSNNLIVVFIDVQPTATMERIFLHCQGLEQSHLQKVTAMFSSSVLAHDLTFRQMKTAAVALTNIYQTADNLQ